MFFSLPQSLKTSQFQLMLLIFTAFYISVLLSWKYRGLHTSEQLPAIEKKSQSIMRYANIVEVGLHINSFLEFSFNKNEFAIDGIVWFRFPVGTESLETISQFTLKNSLIQQNGDVIYKSAPIVRLADDHVSVAFHIQTLFRTDLNYRLFPIGDHKLNLILQNRSVTPHELTFVSKHENFNLSEGILVSNWKPLHTQVKSGYLNASINPNDSSMNISYPCVIFSIDFENSGMRDLISLYFPMFVLFIIGLFSFAINIFDINRLLIIATSLGKRV